MKSSLILFSTVALLWMTACGVPEANSRAADEVEKLQADLVKTDSALRKIDVDKAEGIARIIKNNSQYIQSNMNNMKDTLDFKTGLVLTDYRALYKDLDAVKKNTRGLSTAIDSMQINLGNLISDLRSNTLSDGLTADSALAYEKRQALQLAAFVKEVDTRLKSALAQYDTLSPRVDSYINEMKLKTGISPMQLPEKEANEKVETERD